MPGPNKRWEDEEEEESSSAPTSPPPSGPVRRGKFDDEEAEDSDVLESWDAAEDSEVEREKAKKAAEVKAKAEAEAAAKKKSKAQRIKEHQAERARALAEGDDSSGEEETEAEARERLRRTEKESDMRHAEDLFGAVGISNSSGRKTIKGTVIPIDAADPTKTVDLATLPLFNPATKTQFEALRTTLGPVLAATSKRPHYGLFLQEFSKQLAAELPSDQIKKIASTLTALGNEKMKEEKASDKGSKKTKAAKTKTTLAGVTRGNVSADVQTYEDEAFGDEDFM